MHPEVSQKTVGRWSLYRRLLDALSRTEQRYILSSDLARRSGVTASQARRDLMHLEVAGGARGYEVQALLRAINAQLAPAEPQAVALIGVGNLGRALLSYFQGRRPTLQLVAAFDIDPHKIGRVIHGCRCYPLDELEAILEREAARIVILTLPGEAVATLGPRLIKAGIRAVLNFAPSHLDLPPSIHVEDVDITMSLEKAAFFAATQEQRS
ncbi:redox-sensing transcriptional repressor Rex [Myxococcota bacterium]|nr:redox-sensing transcriptional repressor Rex [Myxococcota bacterium]